MTPRVSNDLLAAHELFFCALFRTMSEEQRVLLLAHLQNLVEARHEPSRELEEFVDRMGLLSHDLSRKAAERREDLVPESSRRRRRPPAG